MIFDFLKQLLIPPTNKRFFLCVRTLFYLTSLSYNDLSLNSALSKTKGPK